MTDIKADYLDPKVYNAVYMYMTYDNVLALRLALCTGLRIGDVLKVKTTDIKGQTLNYTAEKTGKTGKKKIPLTLAAELRRNAAAYRSEYCFPHRLDPTKHRTRQAVFKSLRNACKRAGVTAHVTPHSTRKTYAVELTERSGLAATQAELQHTRSDTTMLYAFANLTDKAAEPTKAATDYDTVYRAVGDALTDFFKNYAHAKFGENQS